MWRIHQSTRLNIPLRILSLCIIHKSDSNNQILINFVKNKPTNQVNRILSLYIFPKPKATLLSLPLLQEMVSWSKQGVEHYNTSCAPLLTLGKHTRALSLSILLSVFQSVFIDQHSLCSYRMYLYLWCKSLGTSNTTLKYSQNKPTSEFFIAFFLFLHFPYCGFKKSSIYQGQ